MTSVVHLRKRKFDIYIGREWAEFSASKWGNPFHIRDGQPRGATLERYEAYVRSPFELEVTAEYDAGEAAHYVSVIVPIVMLALMVVKCLRNRATMVGQKPVALMDRTSAATFAGCTGKRTRSRKR